MPTMGVMWTCIPSADRPMTPVLADSVKESYRETNEYNPVLA